MKNPKRINELNHNIQLNVEDYNNDSLSYEELRIVHINFN